MPKFQRMAGDHRAHVRVEIDENARTKPASTPARNVLPALSSSFRRSKIRMLASTAIPIDRMKPAMPGSVIVTGISLKIAAENAA